MITIQVDTREATRWLNDLQKKQIPYAASEALNNTAKDVRKEAESGMSAFDRPKPVTRRGVFVKRSDKHNLTAIIGLKSRTTGAPPVAEYLAPNIVASRRADKRSEELLKIAGVLPHGKQTRPGPDAKLDAYGNMSKGQIVQIVSYFRAFGGIQSSGRGKPYTTQSAQLNAPAKRRRSSVSLFVTPLGIFERRGRTTKHLVTFTSPQAYSKKYDFPVIATRKLERQWAENFKRAMDNALRTAR